MVIVFGASDCVKPTQVYNKPVALLPLSSQRRSLWRQLNDVFPDLPQLYQVHWMLGPSCPGTSSTLCWSCCVKLTCDIPRPPLLPWPLYPCPPITLMPWIWPEIRINRPKVPAWEVWYSYLPTYNELWSSPSNGPQRSMYDLLNTPPPP